MTTTETLIEFIKTTLNLRTIDPGATMGKVRGWDSVSHVELMLALETQYGVQIPAEAFGQLTSVNEIISYLREHGAIEAPR